MHPVVSDALLNRLVDQIRRIGALTLQISGKEKYLDLCNMDTSNSNVQKDFNVFDKHNSTRRRISEASRLQLDLYARI